MAYVDGFVIPVPKNKVKAYKKMAKLGCKMWMKHGALDYFETVGEDLKVHGGVRSFTKLAKTKPNETVIFAWIVFKNKAHRNKVNKKVMSDPKMGGFDPKDMPFNFRRMAYGGFKAIVKA